MLKHVWLLIFGVILPAITLSVEVSFGISAEGYLNPIPTIWHVLLVGFVPAANFYVLRGVTGPARSSYRRLFWANGMALGIASVYAMAFAPVSPFSAIAVAFWGFGLLPLSPILAFFAAVSICAALHRRAYDRNPSTAGRHVWLTAISVAAGWLVFLAGDLPHVVTRESLTLAVSQDPAWRKFGIWSLRTLGSEKELLRLCRPHHQDIRPTTWGYSDVDELSVRNIFYRTTGRSVSQEQAGRLASRQSGWLLREFDDALGSDSVAGQRRGLYLDKSSMDVTVHADELATYTEWTMEFENKTNAPEEARSQIRLPTDGVVSRLTLWVNGLPREAAFAGTPKVRAAYQKVAVVQRCDPVLVTWQGKDRIFMQCFPVPAHGRMKVRVGVTAPLAVGGGETSLRLPHFLEQNFSPARRMRHAVTAKASDGSALVGLAGNAAEPEQQREWRWTGDQLSRGRIQLGRSVQLASLDPLSVVSGQDVIKQSFQPVSPDATTRLCVVVDGSAAMRPYLESISRAIQQLDSNVRIDLLLAADEVHDLSDAVSPDRGRREAKALRRELERLTAKGGMDNVPALTQAMDRLRFAEHAALVWLHGPLPVELTSRTGLWAGMAAADELDVYDVQLAVGPNRLTEEFAAAGLKQIAMADPEVEIPALFQTLVEGMPTWQRQYTMLAEQTEQPELASHSPVVSLWANDEVSRLLTENFEENREQAVTLAAAHHIVTPVTGAVVLESDQQFKDADLTPVDAKAVNTPEPSTGTLAVMGLFGLWAYARRQRRRAG